MESTISSLRRVKIFTIESFSTNTDSIIDNNLPVEPEMVLYDTHRLLAIRANTPNNDEYLKLTPKESKKPKYRALKHLIGQHWIDKETKEEFVVNTVIMPTKSSGEGSKTPFYSFYNIYQHIIPTFSRELQYTPCSELNGRKYVSWIPRGNSAFALSIIASTPKDPNRALIKQ